VEGSGPGGRELGDWGVRLAAAGFASLAYDKPGSGASTGDWTRQTLEDRASETLAATRVVGHLAGLIGGSQGGWVAHLAAAREPSIPAVVTIGGPGVGVRAQEEYRLSRVLADPAPAIEAFREQVERTDAGEDPASVYKGQQRYHDLPWWGFLAGTTPERIGFQAAIVHYEPGAAIAAMRCPLLAIFGAAEDHVPVEPSERAIKRHKPDADVVVFPDADHNIRIAGRRAAGFDELIVAWLGDRTVLRSPTTRRVVAG
jgi:pimeloyl-ACP methyl ester carboxylesterase